MSNGKSPHCEAFSELPAHHQSLLRVLCELQAVAEDQLARLVGCELKALRPEMVALQRGGWLKSHRASADRYRWLYPSGATASALGVRGKRAPSASSLAHRRAIAEARIILQEEYPRGTWTPEGVLLMGPSSERPEEVPDGLFRQGCKTWAVEAELTRKSTPRIHRHIEGLLSRYDKVIYFCSDSVVNLVRRAQAEFPKGKVEIRPEKTANSLAPLKRRKMTLDPYRPSGTEKELLRLINEEGAIAVDQLSLLSGIEPSALAEELKRLQAERLVEGGYGCGRFAWVWCSYRGAMAVGLGLREQKILSPARLPRRRALMSVRLALKTSHPKGRWMTGRMLKPYEAAEVAVFEQGRRRIAVMVSLGELRRPDARPAPRLASSYDELWWYCTPESRAWVERQVERGGWSNVQVLDLPIE